MESPYNGELAVIVEFVEIWVNCGYHLRFEGNSCFLEKLLRDKSFLVASF